jgi:hypothetical protein
MTCIFRKTRGGRWAVLGPAEVVKAGATVTVKKRDGTEVEVEIADTGKPFERDGVTCVYGYKVAKQNDKGEVKPKRKRRSKRATEAEALRSQVAELQAQLAQLSNEAGAALTEAAADAAE